jgi:undecaprenyl diphosphate synthase
MSTVPPPVFAASSEVDNGAVPAHIAIIMDGNGRWALSRGLSRSDGHRAGVDAVERAVNAALDAGVGYLTLYGFSTENWRRPALEVASLMGLVREVFGQGFIGRLQAKGVRVSFIGDRSALSRDVNWVMDRAENVTRNEKRLLLTIAFNYGSRQELVDAVRSVATAVESGKLKASDVTEETVAGRLMTAGLPDPDLLIRTSGEKRISNFLLWQCAYAELVFVDVLWPDFSAEHFDAALLEFRARQRRFGAV